MQLAPQESKLNRGLSAANSLDKNAVPRPLTSNAKIPHHKNLNQDHRSDALFWRLRAFYLKNFFPCVLDCSTCRSRPQHMRWTNTDRRLGASLPILRSLEKIGPCDLVGTLSRHEMTRFEGHSTSLYQIHASTA
jgi:hypothetical protein